MMMKKKYKQCKNQNTLDRTKRFVWLYLKGTFFIVPEKNVFLVHAPNIYRIRDFPAFISASMWFDVFFILFCFTLQIMKPRIQTAYNFDIRLCSCFTRSYSIWWWLQCKNCKILFIIHRNYTLNTNYNSWLIVSSLYFKLFGFCALRIEQINKYMRFGCENGCTTKATWKMK